MTVRLNKDYLLFFFDLWWVIFLFLTYTNSPALLYNAVSFVSLVFVPGLLILHALRMPRLELWVRITLIVAFSLFFLMVAGLLINTVLPFFGLVRPLDTENLIPSLSLLMALLAGIAWMRSSGLVIVMPALEINWRVFAFSVIPPIFVILSVLGAIRLNNGASNILTLLMLFCIALYAVVLMIHKKELPAGVVPTAIYFISLALLLMTSLRGWHVTGHDIQTEYKVFELAKSAGLWTMSAYQDAYNACMSITILPTLFANATRISDPYIYKVLYQMVFALCPVLIYLISRHWLNLRLSLLAALYFVGFPTYFEDMPFLNRQEIAFLYFGLMIYCLFCAELPIWSRRVLFMLLSLGIVLSHYSTTYTVVVIFGLGVVAWYLLPHVARLLKWVRPDAAVSFVGSTEEAVVTPLMVAGLIVSSFLWTSVITNTGGHLSQVVGQTLHAVTNGFTENSRSLDAMSLITFGKPTKERSLNDYRAEIDKTRAKFPHVFFNENVYKNASFDIVKDTFLPPSSWSASLTALNIPVEKLSSYIGQVAAKFAELSVFVGMCYVLLAGSYSSKIAREYYMLALACLAFIFLNVILPTLSTEYGVFRALQQSFFLLAPFLVIGSVATGVWLSTVSDRIFAWLLERRYISVRIETPRESLGALLWVVFFLYSSTAVPQLVGGNDPALHLNNTGFYYDNYYLHGEEISGIAWLGTYVPHTVDPLIQADRYGKNRVAAFLPVPVAGDIFPGIVEKKSYVFLDWTNVHKDVSHIYRDGSAIPYVYPIDFLDANKNRLYDNASARVYH